MNISFHLVAALGLIRLGLPPDKPITFAVGESIDWRMGAEIGAGTTVWIQRQFASSFYLLSPDLFSTTLIIVNINYSLIKPFSLIELRVINPLHVYARTVHYRLNYLWINDPFKPIHQYTSSEKAN